MHDTGRSGLYLLYPMIAIIGLSMFLGFSGMAQALMGEDPAAAFSGLLGLVAIATLAVVALSPFLVLWWLTRPSQPGSNDYGPNPHEVTQ